MKRSINHAVGLCAVAIVSCLLVLGVSGQASAASQAGGPGKGPAKHAVPAGTTARPAHSSTSDDGRGTAGTSGDATSPQPLSAADQHGGGANGACPGGPYCSTRDGAPSMNGNGGGLATGKPCAGCVGKADNKNPRGQYPNGNDHNAGYECDRNHGIGRTNPAHTGCTGSSTPPTGCVENPATPGPDCDTTPPTGCVENPATPGPDCSTVQPPTVCSQATGCDLVSPPTSSGVSSTGLISAAAPAAAGAGVLPETGSPAGLLAQLLASIVLLAGGVLVLARRRHA